MKRPRLWLALLFLVVVTSQSTFTVDVIRELSGDYPDTPIHPGYPWPTVTSVVYGGSVRAGDRVVTIDGRAPVGQKDLAQAIRAKKPGDTLRVVVDRAGRRVECAIVLRRVTRPWVFYVVWNLFMPWLSIVLGFWVVAVRPRDVRAWAVLGILVGLCQIERSSGLDPRGWPVVMGVVSIFYLNIAERAWPACMLLFGIYFPQRWRADRSVPWIKWLLLAPLAVFGVWAGLRDAVFAVNYPAGQRIPTAPPEWIELVLMALSISVFFFALGAKVHDPKAPLAPDDQRRLKFLHWGAQAALTPFSLVFFYSLIVYRQVPQKGPLLVVALMVMVLLPITMAYVIVVERALDVRVVVRQGVQYALARSGIRVIQFCLALGAIYLSVRFFEAHNVSQVVRYSAIGVEILLVARLRDLGDRVRRWLDRRFFREAYDAERILGELSEHVRTILDTDELFETVTRKIVESLHVERIAVLLPHGGMFRPALATGYPAPLDLWLSGSGPTISRLRQARGPVTVDATEELELAGLDAHLLLPLASKKDLLGFISLGPKRSEEPYSSNDTRLLLTLAAQTGLALENSRLSEAIAHEVSQRELLHREIEIAREVQQRLFPQNLPKVPPLDYAGHCRPALGVGGDYYDFLALPGGQLGLAIADISGKGIPAALLMASLQASVRGQSQGPGDVAALMTSVNRLVYEASPANRYATFFYAQFDPPARRLTWSNGGHNPPFLLRGGEVIRLETGGPVVGLFPRCAYEQDAIVLEAGDLLILYTDGMSEAENAAEEEWGEDALIAAARACAALPPAEMIARIMEAADAFAAGAPQHDDMTLVVARVTD
ncbi:MAG: SpoIIE family protein phosphatase [Bryobacteraceae bacterium]|jgi:sigma-B regulation protein RsbU (phosphoserine phosphatase)